MMGRYCGYSKQGRDEMKTVTVSTAELEGAALDYATAKAINAPCYRDGSIGFWLSNHRYAPSISYTFGGHLIDEWRVALIPEWGAGWTAQCYCGPIEDSEVPQGTGIGFTAAEATCKSIVNAVLGDTVEIPEELVK